MKALNEEQELILRTVRQFVEKEVIPVASAMEHRDEYPHALVAQMKEMGLFGLNIPEEYGGAGVDSTTFAMIFEEISRGWLGLGGRDRQQLRDVRRGGALRHRRTEAPLPAWHGDRRKARRHLPYRIERGHGSAKHQHHGHARWRQSIASTAPRCGSPTRGMATHFCYLAKTDPSAQPAHRGMSAFVIEKGAARHDREPRHRKAGV